MSLNRRNYYRMLYVQPDAPIPVIKAAYRTLAVAEERATGSTSALLTEAYTVLSDPVLRAAYDAKTTVRARHAPLPALAQTTGSATGSAAADDARPDPTAVPPRHPMATGIGARRPHPAARPAGAEPAGAEPAGAEPAGAEPADTEPAGAEPAGAEPAGAEPAGAEPTAATPAAARPAAAAPAEVKTPAKAASASASDSATASPQATAKAPPQAAAKASPQPAAPAGKAPVDGAQAAVACPMCQTPRSGRVTADTRCANCHAPLAPIARPARARAAAGNERRVIPRVGRTDWATLQAPWNAEPVRVRLRDLSADGISVYSSNRIAPGTRVRIGNERFDLVATVVGCRAVRHVYSLHARLETAWVAPKVIASKPPASRTLAAR